MRNICYFSSSFPVFCTTLILRNISQLISQDLIQITIVSSYIGRVPNRFRRLIQLSDANMLSGKLNSEVDFGYTNNAHLLCNSTEQTNQGGTNYG